MIIHGDVSDPKTWEPIEDESVHLVVTSPPYDNLRTYSHGAEFDLAVVASQLMRVLVPGGIVCWIVGDAVVAGSETLTSFRQAIHFVDVVGFRMHDTMIWHKKNFSSPSFNRYHQCFEYMFILTKGEPRCFNPIKDKPNSTAGRVGNLGVNTFMKRDGSRSTRAKYVTEEIGMRHNVWDGLTRGQEEMCEKMPHPAMMPKWLARDLIISWSNKGDIVLDPFAGSGTVPIMAKRLERVPIAIDISKKYLNELVEPGLASVNPLFTGGVNEKTNDFPVVRSNQSASADEVQGA